jgi:hypothetical protein
MATAWTLSGCLANPEPAPLVVASPAVPATSAPPTSSATPNLSPTPLPETSPTKGASRSATKTAATKKRTNASANRSSPPVTAADVESTVRAAGLPRLSVVTQPAPRTRVGIETVFYTRPVSFSRTYTIHGSRVEVQARPVSFRWSFGDGSTRTTSSPGAPYPNHTVTHRYASAGTRYPSVTTSYTVTYRVSGGAWRALPGSFSSAGAGTRLQVVKKV